MAFNVFTVLKNVLMVFLLIILIVMVYFCVMSVAAISRNESKKHNTNQAITTALVALNALVGLMGTYKEHFINTLVFAVIQTVLIIIGFALAVEDWFAIPWIGSAILAYIFAFMINQGYSEH